MPPSKCDGSQVVSVTYSTVITTWVKLLSSLSDRRSVYFNIINTSAAVQRGGRPPWRQLRYDRTCLRLSNHMRQDFTVLFPLRSFCKMINKNIYSCWVGTAIPLSAQLTGSLQVGRMFVLSYLVRYFPQKSGHRFVDTALKNHLNHLYQKSCPTDIRNVSINQLIHASEQHFVILPALGGKCGSL